MKATLGAVWRVGRWVLLAIFVAYAALVIYRIPAVGEKQKSDAMVAHIKAQHITLADVMGTNLPPAPDEATNNATVAGIDANHNGIRDDVELAIFKEYPNSAKIRAAELQYALALQIEMTQVFDTATWLAAVQEDARGDGCISLTYPRTDLKEFLQVVEARSKEIEDLTYNTQARKDAQVKVATFTTSFGVPNSNLCDIDLASLPN